ncbi:MAG: hypothetical protein WC718_16345 [Phycisphaerales bacterium]
MSGPTIAELRDLIRNASPKPWRHEASAKFSGEDWLLASLGNGNDDLNHYICTDHIRCSEMTSGGAWEDAELIVALRNNAWELLARIELAERVMDGEATVDEYDGHFRPQCRLPLNGKAVG